MTSGKRGSYAIEFALVLPLLLAVIGAIVEYGSFFNQQIDMVGVVRDTIRTGATQRHTWTPTPIARAREVAFAGLIEQGWDPQNAVVDVTLSGSAPDQVMSVSISVPYRPIFGMIPVPKSVNGGAVMRMEDQP